MAGQSQETSTSVIINTDIGMVMFDSSAVDYINDRADSGATLLEVNVVDPTTLSEDDQALIGDHPVYGFYLMAGDTQVSAFSGGSADVCLRY